MSLDPTVRALLERLAGALPTGQEPAGEVSLARLRAAFSTLAGLARVPDEPLDVEELIVPGAGGDVPVRVYRPPPPRSAPGPLAPPDRVLPLVVLLHGGGWALGDLDTHDALARRLAAGVPAVVVSVAYRLAPEHPFPAGLEDCLEATRWAASRAGELGADPARLAVAGDSTGGNLAAAVARRRPVPVAFQALLYPVTDLTCSQRSYEEKAAGYLLTAETMAWFISGYLGPDGDPEDPDASPLHASDLAGAPPALIVTAEHDPVRDEGEAYAERLADAGVEVQLSRYQGMIHHFLGMDAILPEGARGLEEVVEALRRAL